MAATATPVLNPSSLLPLSPVSSTCAVVSLLITSRIALAIAWDMHGHEFKRAAGGSTVYFIVIVQHNLVEQIQRRDSLSNQQVVLQTNLEASALLTDNFRVNQCIDGEYCFDDAERAKSFASVCMDFMKKLVLNRLERIDKLNSGEQFIA